MYLKVIRKLAENISEKLVTVGLRIADDPPDRTGKRYAVDR